MDQPRIHPIAVLVNFQEPESSCRLMVLVNLVMFQKKEQETPTLVLPTSMANEAQALVLKEEEVDSTMVLQTFMHSKGELNQ